MNVVIRRNHTAHTRFDFINNGPLVQACKEQAPELNIIREYDGHCLSADNTLYSFDHSNSGYNRLTYAALADKEIKEIHIDLVPVLGKKGAG